MVCIAGGDPIIAEVNIGYFEISPLDRMPT